MEVLGFNFPDSDAEKSMKEFISNFIILETDFEIRKKVFVLL